MPERNLLRGLVFAGLLCASVAAIPAKASTTNEAKVSKPGAVATPAQKPGEIIHTETPKFKMPLSYYIPASCVGKESVPLIVSYHGKGGNNEGEIGSWVGLSEKYGFAVACPKSYFAGGVRPASDKRPLGPLREVEDALAVVEMLKGKCRIDDRFIMVTGFSGGALPAYTAGLLNPNVFRYVGSRSGNFPDPLIVAARQQAGTRPQIIQSIGVAVTNSHFYFQYGEKDHPIVLNDDGPAQTSFLEGNKSPHFKKVMIPGMGHDSRPDLAAEWFAGEIAAALAHPQGKDIPRK